jgi:hypothetical protein
MDKVFQIKKPTKAVPNICLPFLSDGDWMIFSIATSIGTRPKNKKKVVYCIGGHASQSNKPENMDSRMFLFIIKIYLVGFLNISALKACDWPLGMVNAFHPDAAILPINTICPI